MVLTVGEVAHFVVASSSASVAYAPRLHMLVVCRRRRALVHMVSLMRRCTALGAQAVIRGAVVAVGLAVVRGRYLRWGASDDEVNAVLAGDDLVPDANVVATRAVTVGAAAVDVWTLYAAAIVSGFGIAIMQPGMPTLVREWLPSRLALGTIGYSSGMLMGAMFPAVFTIAFILPAVGGSWRLDVVLWAIPALLIAPVFLLASPKIAEDVDKQAAGGGRWWPDWKNPVVWLLGFTFASNNSPYFVTSAFLGDYLATLGKPELLGAALGWLNGSQLVAMAVLFLTANRLQMRAWPFLVFGPTMLAAFLVMMIFVTSSLAIVAATAVIGIAGAVSMTAILALPPFLSLPADVPRTAAGMFTISYTCAIIIPTICGALWDLTGKPWTAFVPLCLCAVALAVLGTVVTRRSPDRSKAAQG